MSGALTDTSILAGASGVGASYDIDNSARFNNPGSGDGSPGTSRLTKTFGTPTNNKVWTVSLWAKRGQLSTGGSSAKRFFGSKKSGSATAFYCGFEETNSLSFRYFDSTDTEYKIKGTPLFRDCAAWLHCVFQFNSAHATSTERMKMWVNGEQITVFDSTNYPPQNNLAGWNEDGFVSIMGGNVGNASTPTYEYGWDGLLAEVHFVDGQALTPASFAETDEDTNEWKAIEYDGTHGDNGFYFEFKDSANFGIDSSANASNWTAASMGAEDQMIDTPQNSTGSNFATWNFIFMDSDTAVQASYEEGNLKTTCASTGSGDAWSKGTIGVSSGKWYWEYYINSISSDNGYFGAASIDTGSSGPSMYYSTNAGTINSTGETQQTSIPTASNGDIVSIAIDLDASPQTAKVYLNNSQLGTAINLQSGNTWTPFFLNGNSGVTKIVTLNCGQDSSFAGGKTAQGNSDGSGNGDFYYTPPSGYLALCSANLPDPSIALPGDHFNTVLYTGNGTNATAITGVGFSPEWVWIKNRSSNVSHETADQVRGENNILMPDSDEAQFTDTSHIQSFDSDGFTIGTNSAVNTTDDNYVSWNWKAGGAPTADNSAGAGNTPTAGSVKIDGSNLGSALAGNIAAKRISASTTSGISIVEYVGVNSDTSTVAHGLSVAPDFVVIKRLDSAGYWIVSSPELGTTTYPHDVYLNDTSNQQNDQIMGGQPTSSVFQIRSSTAVNASSGEYIAYCFHSVEGYSKVGSYTGNGNTDGPFIFTDFTPAFLIVKNIETSGTNWRMYDNKRPAYNPENLVLYANSTAAVGSTGHPFDFISNGAKVRGDWQDINTNGQTYLYIMFAESPFKYSRAR